MSVVFTVALTLLVSYLLGCFNGSVMTSHFIIRDDVRSTAAATPGPDELLPDLRRPVRPVRHHLRHGQNRSGLPHRRVSDALGGGRLDPGAC